MAYKVSDSYQSPSWGKALDTRNSPEAGVTPESLAEAVKRAEHLDAIGDSIKEDRADLFKELKARKFNIPAFRKFLAKRKQNANAAEAERVAAEYAEMLEDE